MTFQLSMPCYKPHPRGQIQGGGGGKLLGQTGGPCADPEGGGDRGSGPPPPWNLKILPTKGNFGIFGGLDPHLVCDKKKIPFSLDPLS